jgi:Flp pilus assembly protein TadD
VVRNLEWQNDIVLFTRTLTAQPDAYEIRTNLGTAYWAQGDVTDAEREWREALRLAPLSPIILNNLGLVCRQRKQYGQAVEFVRKSVQQKPDYTEAHLTLGITYEEMGLRRQAELEYGTALQLSPLNVCARNRLGRTYLGEGRLADAEREFAQSVKTEPNPSGFDGQGDVELASGRPDLAIRAFQAALKLNPIDSHAHFRLGDLEMAAGNKTAALGEYEAGLKTDPANSAARASISNLKAQTSNVESDRP